MSYSDLVEWFEDHYNEDVLFSEDAFYPDNKDEWIYRFGLEITPSDKRDYAKRQLNPVSGNEGNMAQRIYDNFFDRETTLDFIRNKQDFVFYNTLINQNIARTETLEFGRELAIEEFRSGNRREGEKFLSEWFPSVLGGILRGEQQSGQKAFRQTFQ